MSRHANPFVSAFLVLALVLAFGTSRAAEPYPNRPIRIINPVPAGGTLDVLARVLGDKLKDRIGQPLIIESRPGANGMIGLAAAQQAKPDGYTLLGNSTPMASGRLLHKSFTIDVANDFDHIVEVIAASQYLASNPGAPFKTLQEMVAYAKANPGKINFGTSVSIQLDSLMLLKSLGIEVNLVPYSGSGVLPQAVLGDSTQVIHVSLPPIKGLLAENRVRGLAVVSLQRSGITPNVPAIGELFADQDPLVVHSGISGPKGLPREVIQKLNAEINAVLKMPEIVARYADVLGAEVRGGTPEEWRAVQDKTYLQFTRGTQALKIQPQ